MEDLKKQVRDYVVENFLFGDTDVTFSDTDSFMEQGILDSTGILELILFLEETFEIKIEDDELVPENLDSLGNIARFVKEKK